MGVEVFKTNVEEGYQAALLLAEIHHRFPAMSANFDLDDCDHILRVKTSSDIFLPEPIIHLLKIFGFHAEVLTDEVPHTRTTTSKLSLLITDTEFGILEN